MGFPSRQFGVPFYMVWGSFLQYVRNILHGLAWWSSGFGVPFYIVWGSILQNLEFNFFIVWSFVLQDLGFYFTWVEFCSRAFTIPTLYRFGVPFHKMEFHSMRNGVPSAMGCSSIVQYMEFYCTRFGVSYLVSGAQFHSGLAVVF